MSTKAQLESKVASLEALLEAELNAHDQTARQLDAAEAKIVKNDQEWKAVVAGMRQRNAMQYRRLTNTSGVSEGGEASVEQRATVTSNSFAQLEGESNAQFIQRIRKTQQPAAAN